MRINLLLIACLALILSTAAGCSHLQFWTPRHGALHIKAFIDGSDMIFVKGNELWYEHHKWDLPGKWQGRFDEPTYINGEPWKPKWRGKVSNIYQKVRPAFPKAGADGITLTKTKGRGPVTIDQAPGPDNEYRLSIFLNDNGASGAAWYDILVEW